MSKRTCSIDGCKKKVHARELCSTHYSAYRLSPEFEKISFDRGCSVEGCSESHYGRGWCATHYDRWRRTGQTSVQRPRYARSPEEAFSFRTEWQGDCLVWTAPLDHDGYGKMRVNGRKMYVHRYAWERVHGPIPDGMTIDHICHNRACVNDAHLRLATRGQNTSYLRGANKANKASGIRNVYPNNRGWKVVIRKDRTPHYFGTYADIDEAAEVAERERIRLFGEFAGKG